MKKKFLLFTVFIYCLQLCRAQHAGDLDSSFGTYGIVTSSLNNSKSIALQSNGKILIAGYGGISRYNPDGSPDNTFGINGAQPTSFEIASIVVQSDDKFVTAGNTRQGPGMLTSHLFVSRFNADGSPDNTFNGNGQQTTDIDAGINSYAVAASVAVQSNGKIVLAAHHSNALALIRYNADGTLDNTFNGNGKLITDLSVAAGPKSILIQSDGKILVAAGKNADFAIARYNSNGTPDNTFDGDGLKTIDFGYDEGCGSIAIQADGKIVVSGTQITPWESLNMCVARLNVDGSPDNSFSDDGKQIIYFQNSEDNRSLAIEGDGKILIGGSTWIYPNGAYFIVARLSSDGNLDSTFSDDGIQVIPFNGFECYVNDLAIFNNKLYAAHYPTDIARYILLNGPYTAITVPANNSVFNAPATIDITASAYNPDAAITKVEFYDGSALLHTDNISPYTYSWTNVPIGNYTITAKAFYSSGDPVTSQEVHVSVVKMQPPTISFESPSDNASFDGPATILLKAIAQDAHTGGAISKVEFFNDNTLLATVTNSPYTFSWTNVPEGNFTLTAKATDNTGLTASAIVHVSVHITKPTFGLNFNGANVFNVNNGSTDANESASVTVCDGGQYTTSSHFHSSASNLYNITAVASGGILLFDGNQAGNAVFTAAQLSATAGTFTIKLADPNVGATVVQTITPFIDQNNNSALDAGDLAGDPIVFTYSATPKPTWYKDADGDHHASQITRSCTSPGQGWTMTQLPVDDCNDNSTIPCPDNKPPTVKIKTPVNGASYPAPANVILSADAHDPDGKIKTVEFYNGNTLIFTELAAPWYRKWFHLPVGNYTITARATDNKGAVTISAPVNITVTPDIAPSVNITSPADGAHYSAPANIELSADAGDVDGILRTVDFYNGSTLLFTEKYLPYSKTWIDVPEGNYSITAVATDNNGKTTTSIPVNISVGAEPAPMARGGKLNSSSKLLSLNLNPNPVAKTLNISVDGLQANSKSTISVLSASGAVIKTISSNTLNKNIQLDVSSLSAGAYFIKIIDDDKILYKRFVKL